jgi:hypothetical protein
VRIARVADLGGVPDIFAVLAASFDDVSRYRPQVVSYTVSGYEWDCLKSALPKFDKMPQMWSRPDRL